MESLHPLLLEKYLNGTSSAEETRQAEAWLVSDKADLSILKDYVESQWDGKQTLINSDTDTRMLAVLQQRLYPELVDTTIHRSHRPKQRWMIYAVAACLIPLLVVAGLFLFRANDAPWQHFSNSKTLTQQLQLPDGSHIWLSPNSELSYPADFNNSAQRQVRLTGEAFFDIAPDKEHPFLIYTDSIQTTVLGTAFNIEAYTTEKQVRVSLVNGKVSIHKTNGAGIATSPQLLQPGELLRWETNTDLVHKERIPQLNLSQWTKGYTMFNDILLTDALKRIAQRYQLKVEYAEGLQTTERRITTVLKEDPLDELIHILPLITPYKYKIQKEVLYVTKK